MRIGFDISQTGTDKAGCGYFADGLIHELAEIDSTNQYVLYPLFGDAWCDPPLDEMTTHIERPGWGRGPVPKSAEAARDFWANTPDDFERQLGQVDLIHSNNFYCPTVLTRTKLVYTLYDLAFLDHPDLTTEQNRIHVFNGVFNAAVLADFIIAISHSTRDHFLRIFPHYPPEKIAVVYPASRFAPNSPPVQRPAAFDRLRPGQFWLTVGTIEPRKNHRRLLEAYALLKRRRPDTPPLVLAGAHGWLMEGFDKVAENLGIAHDVVILGYVEDRALQWLYENCMAFCYPSLFEGFGLPVLEAMTLGVPVVSSNASSLPEIVGDAAPLFDPGSAESIASAMADLQEHPQKRESIRQNVQKRALLFSWDTSARSVLDIYRRVVAQGLQPAASAK
jgi:glycosyltransferase involved in cell wall biosynthesis